MPWARAAPKLSNCSANLDFGPGRSGAEAPSDTLTSPKSRGEIGANTVGSASVYTWGKAVDRRVRTAVPREPRMPTPKRNTRVLTQFKPGSAEQGLTKPGDDPISLGIDGSIVINTAKLQPPKNVYDADVAWVVKRNPEFVSFFFAKENLNPDKNEFRTRVEIKYPVESFYYHIWKNTREFHEGLRNEKHPVAAPQHTASVQELMSRNSEREHSEWSNFEIMARSGTHACLDFFLLSPAGVARFAKGGGSNWLQATGVLRVYTTITEVRSALDQCVPLANELEPIFSKAESEKES
jgi:hypothetical protein